MRTSPLTRALAWVPALVVLLVPLWLLLRATTSGRASALLGESLSLGLLPLILRSIGLALAVTLASLVIAVPLAWLTARTDLPLRRTCTILLALPLAIPSYVGAFALISAVSADGPLGALLGGSVDLQGFFGATIALTLLGFPYVFLPLHAAFAGLDPRLEESARMLGRSPLGAFLSVSLPLVRPALVGGCLMTTLYVLSDFGAVSMLQVDTFTRVIYVQHDAFDAAGAALLSLVLVLITFVVLALEWRTRNQRLRTSSRAGRDARAAPPSPLGRWRLPALAFVLVVLAASVGAPLLVVIWWALRRGNVCEFCAPIDTLATNSLLVALMTALAAMLLALPVARLASRARSLWAHLPDRVVYAGFAIPGVVVALAFVYFGTRVVPALYQTIPLLVLACVIRFLPQVTDTLRPALERIPPSLEEAARTLGASSRRAFVGVSLPLAMGALLAGGALVFLTTVKELPATLVMRPAGWDTLATELWDLTNEGYYGEAALRALALFVLGVLPMLFITLARQRRRS